MKPCDLEQGDRHSSTTGNTDLTARRDQTRRDREREQGVAGALVPLTSPDRGEECFWARPLAGPHAKLWPTAPAAGHRNNGDGLRTGAVESGRCFPGGKKVTCHIRQQGGTSYLRRAVRISQGNCATQAEASACGNGFPFYVSPPQRRRVTLRAEILF
ncbi:hypothetical protein AAFF_G00381740 [Aldrovandia affinis]|uniref:Uncharacterized protein n=1 Tax=Aldrovandia affinis TaxID=143900 RepID=A0AAD7T8Z7_9TELE|nr:hypothetical protein AAFF_G00381740 [Aldrovandia affinis]